MADYDAQAALDDIRHRQNQACDEYIRHVSSRSHSLLAALALFAMFASFDLPRPWNIAAALLGSGLGAVGLVIQQRRAPVRRKVAGVEAVFYVWLGVAFWVVFSAVLIAARLLGLPAPSTLAAAVVALASLVAGNMIRPVVKAIARRDGHR
ncbi:hypothetical protein DY245_43465 [Streptomyces inhibens]|uniref:Transmembrane protein n=1 Tax=Streptomyces inhibens TaxID=2293571 RepID=A0A371PPF4_STRIH|nr:hypothetical protein [Streptomyces inhibens]REK84408.1 hypothetical protein DY245_43465 [Streptomyces inhibens]